MKVLIGVLTLFAVSLILGCGTGGLDSTSSGGSGSGTLSILADTGTKLYVSGSFVGTTNVVLSRSPGTYSVEGRRGGSGATCWTRSARVDAGKTTRVTVTGSCGF